MTLASVPTIQKFRHGTFFIAWSFLQRAKMAKPNPELEVQQPSWHVKCSGLVLKEEKLFSFYFLENSRVITE